MNKYTVYRYYSLVLIISHPKNLIKRKVFNRDTRAIFSIISQFVKKVKTRYGNNNLNFK